MKYERYFPVHMSGGGHWTRQNIIAKKIFWLFSQSENCEVLKGKFVRQYSEYFIAKQDQAVESEESNVT